MTKAYGKTQYIILLLLLIFFRHYLNAQSFVCNGDAVFTGGDCYQLTPNQADKLGTIWYSELIDLTEPFDIKFDLYFGVNNSDGADGIVFVLQTVGNDAIGVNGLGIGYAGFSPSLGIEFDTFDNSPNFFNGDISDDHTGILRDGSTDHTSPQSLAGPTEAGMNLWWPVNIEDGADHNVRIHWEPDANNLIEVYFDCDQRLSLNYNLIDSIFGGNTNVFWGFTSATGMLFNEHRVCVQTNTITLDTVYICEGGSTTLLAGGAGPGGSYDWTPNYYIDDIHSETPVVSPAVSTTYYVTSTDVCGFQKTDSVRVLVVPYPVVNLGPDMTICTGGTVILDAGNPGASYLWSTGETDQSVTVSPVSQTLYSVTVTAFPGCTASDETDIDISSSLPVDIGQDTTVCEGSALTFAASGGIVYQWSNSATTASITITPASSGVYSVTVSDGGGCTGTDAVSVTVEPAPVADAGSDGTVCTGESVTLTATGGGTYNWSGGAQQGVSFVPVMTSWYYVTVTDAQGCTDTDSLQVTVNPLPAADAGSDVSICAGPVTLTATGGISYEWNTTETTANISVNPSSTTVYSVTVTDSNGCTDNDNVTVTVSGSLTANAGNDVALCYGESTVLTAIGGAFYYWNTTETTASITVAPSVTTDYFVTVSDGGSCTGTDSVTVSVDTPPVVTITGNTVVCAGEPVTLTASGGQDYVWSTASSSATMTSYPFLSTTYTVTVSNATGCTASSGVSVTVNPLPSVDAGSDVSTCGSPVTLTASGGSSYMWNTGASTASITVNPSSTTTYYISATDINGCQGSDSVIVTTGGTISANAGPDRSICSGANAVLTASGGTSYLWSTGESTDAITVSPPVSSVYIVTVIDGACTDTDTVTVVVDDPSIMPVLSVSSLPATCYGNNNGSVDLSVSNGQSPYIYSWSNGATGQDIYNLAAGIYSVTVTDADQCTAQTVVSVDQPAGFNVNVIASAYSYCSGDPVIISMTPGGGQSPYQYYWNNVSTDQSLSVQPDTTTVYTGWVVDADGCMSLADSVIISVPLPIVVNLYPSAESVCEGEEVVITVEWSGGVGVATVLFDGFITTPPVSVHPQQTTEYTVTVQDGCRKTDETITVNVDPSPPISYFADYYSGCVPFTVTYHETSVEAGQTYYWHFGETGAVSVEKNPEYTYTSPGTYDVTLTVTSTDGCTASDTCYPMITANANPVAAFEMDPREVTAVEGKISFTNYSTGADSYLWDFGDGQTSTLTELTHPFPDIPGEYTVTLTASTDENCEDIAAAIVRVTDNYTFYAPNALLPEDGQFGNDRFRVFINGLKEGSFHLIIYDRWGEKVFETFQYDHPWDGRIKGGDIGESGVYTWVVDFRFDKASDDRDRRESGAVTLIR
ncbi:MAG: PKD domain-containing protein [Bacteroidetes bacterium]|nr:PKD domain-containing protein [Bacteroidota bacterium]